MKTPKFETLCKVYLQLSQILRRKYYTKTEHLNSKLMQAFDRVVDHLQAKTKVKLLQNRE